MKGLLDMRLNNNFLIHKTSTGEILVPVEEESKSFHGIIKLNETGSEIVHLLDDNDLSMDELLSHFYNSYPDEDKELIKQSVNDFVNKLREINAIK